LNIPLLQTARVDGAALGCAAVLAFATGLAFGLAPALQLSRASRHEHLKEAGRSTGSSRGGSRIRQLLIVSQVSMACVLLVGAGLLIRSFVQLIDVDLGFRPEQTAAWRIQPNREFATNSQEMAFYKELLRNIEALPGVDRPSRGSEVAPDSHHTVFVDRDVRSSARRAQTVVNDPSSDRQVVHHRDAT
jgi:hypothetical protein